MRCLIKNTFHNSEAVVGVKQVYIDAEYGALTALEFEAYTGGLDAQYAKRKIREIKGKLCGHSDCTCEGFMKLYLS